jgi:hypothetical protein
MRSKILRVTAGGWIGALALLLATPGAVWGQDAPSPATPSPESLSPAFDWDPNDPRPGLAAGWLDAETAISNLELLASVPRPEGFYNPESPHDQLLKNTDVGFQGDYMYLGNYNGFQVWNISEPVQPTLALGIVCPGQQGDVSVYGDLLVVSAQSRGSRIDCGTEGVADSISVERFGGVRVFDLSDFGDPRQVAAVQACRNSHTHTLVTDPTDDENIYVYIQGTSSPRPPEELAGCSDAGPEDPSTSLFRIEVVRIPLDAPERAEIVNTPRIFADRETGSLDGLWPGGDHGPGTQAASITNRCHDITAYPDIGLAAGACRGNGILLDITDPVNPVRIEEVTDPNFAMWHSATFNNDGTKVLFTDEWGGGTRPRCRAHDPPTWGANAIFSLEEGELQLRGYYKLPVPQGEMENCVAHNGSLIPVPGRDIKVQAWYQGGISVLDFTDSANPFEIAYFDRGPQSAEELYPSGYWSAYWYNGVIYGAEELRGIDVFRLTPSEHLSEAEIAAAELVQVARFNPQHQDRVEWPAAVPVARSYLEQMVRADRILDARAEAVSALLDRAEGGSASAAELRSMAATLEADVAAIEAGSAGGDADRTAKLADVLRRLAD